MEQQQLDEFRQLQAEALRLLRTDSPLPPRTFRIRYIAIPSFTEPAAYELLLEEGEEDGTARSTIWRLNDDLEKFRNPVIRLAYGTEVRPTLDMKSRAVGADAIERVLERAARLEIPYTGSAVGIDGTIHEMSIEGTRRDARFQWWQEPRAGWKDLPEIAGMIIALAPPVHDRLST